MTPKEYGQYLQAVNKETATVLPKIEIEGIVVQDGKHELAAAASEAKGAEKHAVTAGGQINSRSPEHD